MFGSIFENIAKFDGMPSERYKEKTCKKIQNHQKLLPLAVGNIIQPAFNSRQSNKQMGVALTGKELIVLNYVELNEFALKYTDQEHIIYLEPSKEILN